MKRLLLATTLLAAPALCQPALADTQSTAMAVSATVSTICSITANPLPFLEVALTGTTDAQTTVAATCTNGGTYDVGLDNGLHANSGQRRLASGANFLNYEIYSDNTRDTRWGNDVGVDTVSGTGNGSAQTLDVYASILAGQTLTTGSYADSIQVTVTY